MEREQVVANFLQRRPDGVEFHASDRFAINRRNRRVGGSRCSSAEHYLVDGRANEYQERDSDKPPAKSIDARRFSR